MSVNVRADEIRLEAAIRSLLETLGYYGDFCAVETYIRDGITEVEIYQNWSRGFDLFYEAAEFLYCAGYLTNEAGPVGVSCGVVSRYRRLFETGAGVDK